MTATDDKTIQRFFALLRAGLWGASEDMEGESLSHDEFKLIAQLASQQAVLGLVSQGLVDSGYKLERKDAFNLYGLQQNIRQRNSLMDKAVVALCQKMQERGIRIFVFKGQPLARNYEDAGLRQSGDIDFYCHPEDWNKAATYFKDELKLSVNELSTAKDIEFRMDGVAYEMHNRLTLLSNPRHSRYWEETVMPEILCHPYSVNINGYEVPTLAPTYNVLYVFVHIFQHLISDGIGLRQFCDWAVLLSKEIEKTKRGTENLQNALNIDLLIEHLKGIGLENAFTGLGTVLTDYLGFKEEDFPCEISDEEHQKASKLLDDILEKGNFGHNQPMKHRSGVMHGFAHLKKIFLQSRKFGHYAPNEVWWKIPYMFKWWGIKIKRMATSIFTSPKKKTTNP